MFDQPICTLDPADGSQSDRWDVSGHYGATSDHWKFSSSLYVIHSTMVLWNDFTHLLDDPINGHQEQQDETRTTTGGRVSLTYFRNFGSIMTETTAGLQDRFDGEYIDRRHTKNWVVLPYCNDGDCRFRVREGSLSRDWNEAGRLLWYLRRQLRCQCPGTYRLVRRAGGQPRLMVRWAGAAHSRFLPADRWSKIPVRQRLLRDQPGLRLQNYVEAEGTGLNLQSLQLSFRISKYYYATDINAVEVAKYGTTGVSDFQVHPLEPLSGRLMLTASF